MKKVIESIDSKVLEKVCSITIDDEKNKLLFDCNGDAIKITARYTRAINMRYRKNREKNGLRDEEISVVWILVGVKGEKRKYYKSEEIAHLRGCFHLIFGRMLRK